MADTLGLLEEAMQLARDVGFAVREEPLGDAPGGACTVGGRRQILVNAALPAARRLDVLLDVLAAEPSTAGSAARTSSRSVVSSPAVWPSAAAPVATPDGAAGPVWWSGPRHALSR